MDQSQHDLPLWTRPLPESIKTPTPKTISQYNWWQRRKWTKEWLQLPTLTLYLKKNSESTPLIIVVPGGGYGGRAPHEAGPIAKWINLLGYSAVVLNYRVFPMQHPVPFLDAQRAVRYIRFHAKEWHINPDRIGMLGFSAGGHLTSCIGTLADRNFFPPEYVPDLIDNTTARLNAMVLCYAVISFKHHAHNGCIQHLLGKNPDPNMIQLFSTDEQITKITPPTFLWSTLEDSGVPFQNSTSFAEALQNHGITHEIHIFKTGQHGLGLAENNAEVHQWINLCAEWLKKIWP